MSLSKSGTRLSNSLALRTELLTLLASLFFTCACNGAFWAALTAGRTLSAPGTWFLVFCTGVLMTGLQWLWLLLIVNRYTVKPVLTLLFLCTSAAVYFMATFGVYFNPSMLHNLLGTDPREVKELLNWKMVPYLLLFGVLPILLLWRTRTPRTPFKRAILWRGASLVAALVMVAAGAWPVLDELIPTMREQKETRYLVTPSNYIVSMVSVLAPDSDAHSKERVVVGADAHPMARSTARKPRAFVLVIGETVRAANWGLSGYARETTPELAARKVINFNDVSSCGTDTATSLPCMFSVYGRRDYDRKRIQNSESLLHVLHRAGVATFWRDNQGGCKGVCDGLAQENLSRANAPDFCNAERCFDGILLTDLKEKIDATSGDFLIVLHMLGNHGPAYYQRYPSQFRRWTPTCDTTDLASCSKAAVVNTYDNAILYTDHVLSQAIDALSNVETHDTALLYVSDHGESLGENNLYLHGLPYAIAPKEQTHVPMIMWFSPGFKASTGLDASCLAMRTTKPASHDNLFQTTLGLFDIQTSIYDPAWDLAAACRP